VKLFLASEAKHPKSFQKLKEYIGGFEGKKITYIPTASNGELPWDEWRHGETWELINSVNANITVCLLEDFMNLNFPKSLENQDIIWFAGGACGYLMYWVKRTNLDLYLPNLLNKGIIYVGSSAGSMITAPTLGVSEWYLGEEERGANYLPGLGLVDFDFYPHFEDPMYDEIKAKFKNGKIYLVKNGEALIVENGIVKVYGEERLIIK
jgi:dipeptidase E